MEFRANLFKLEIYSFNQIEEHNLQAVNWIFYYPIKLNEQLLENVTSSKDLTKIQGVIKGALDSLYYCKELLLSGILPDNHDILEKKRNIHFRLMCCDQEKETDDFNNYELVICEKTVMKKCISCKMLKNTLNQHVFSALEARYKFIRNFIGKCGSEKSLLIIVSNEQKWLTRASKIIDVIGNANLSFA
ncbi:hypothetical protein T4E_1437 [Trichinella pseudospiralis]|uniref:Uncharacterized protein n=1 Tax=Trichinella pseudospiralis TaxID=6337 RepID=A0A0V0YCT4_TRIPS|nr:hypothetical protein T4E_1437 [Trichinella pseudospiralis]